MSSPQTPEDKAEKLKELLEDPDFIDDIKECFGIRDDAEAERLRQWLVDGINDALG